jgi:hypothetical protein
MAQMSAEPCLIPWEFSARRLAQGHNRVTKNDNEATHTFAVRALVSSVNRERYDVEQAI